MSKIPEGATHTYTESSGTSFRRMEGSSWLGYADGDWIILSNPASHLHEPIQAGPEWTGEGLPPVGAICELWVRDDLWASCQVIAMDDQDGQPVSVVRYGGGYYAGTNKCLRPVLSAEQVAAEDRKKAIDEMVYGACGCRRGDGTTTAAMICGFLYDAGYRKQVEK